MWMLLVGDLRMLLRMNSVVCGVIGPWEHLRFAEWASVMCLKVGWLWIVC